MFWSGETLLARLPGLSNDFNPEAIDCNAWTLTIGKKIYITPTAAAAKSGSHTVRDLKDGESFQIPSGQFAFLQTSERVKIPTSAMAFISIKASIKLKGLINVSGFHVDPGFDGVLLFTVYNAGPSPIHLHQGQQCFLIWFASLDNEQTAFVKTAPSTRRVDGDTVGGIAGSLQSFDDFASRLVEVEHKIRLIETIGKTVIGIAISVVVGLIWMQSKKDPVPQVTALNPPTQHSLPPTAVGTMPPAQALPAQAQAQPTQTLPSQARPAQDQSPTGANTAPPSAAPR